MLNMFAKDSIIGKPNNLQLLEGMKMQNNKFYSTYNLSNQGLPSKKSKTFTNSESQNKTSGRTKPENIFYNQNSELPRLGKTDHFYFQPKALDKTLSQPRIVKSQSPQTISQNLDSHQLLMRTSDLRSTRVMPKTKCISVDSCNEKQRNLYHKSDNQKSIVPTPSRYAKTVKNEHGVHYSNPQLQYILRTNRAEREIKKIIKQSEFITYDINQKISREMDVDMKFNDYLKQKYLTKRNSIFAIEKVIGKLEKLQQNSSYLKKFENETSNQELKQSLKLDSDRNNKIFDVTERTLKLKQNADTKKNTRKDAPQIEIQTDHQNIFDSENISLNSSNSGSEYKSGLSESFKEEMKQQKEAEEDNNDDDETPVKVEVKKKETPKTQKKRIMSQLNNVLKSSSKEKAIDKLFESLDKDDISVLESTIRSNAISEFK